MQNRLNTWYIVYRCINVYSMNVFCLIKESISGGFLILGNVPSVWLGHVQWALSFDILLWGPGMVGVPWILLIRCVWLPQRVVRKSQGEIAGRCDHEWYKQKSRAASSQRSLVWGWEPGSRKFRLAFPHFLQTLHLSNRKLVQRWTIKILNWGFEVSSL